MLKKLNRMWLSSVRKAGKAQQARTVNMFKAMLAQPSPVKAVRVKSSASAVPRKPKAAIKTAALPGTWSNAYCSTDTVPVRRMRYWLYLPPAETVPASGKPLLVMLHGCEQNAADFAEGTRMNRLAGDKGYAVLYPQQSLRTHPNRCWKWYDPATQRGGGDIALIVRMIRHVIEEHAIDPRRIYVCGISAGAAMAQILALTHPELIAAVGMHSGPVFGVSRTAMGAYGVMQHGSANSLAPIVKVLEKIPAFPPMPAILITGDDDKVVRSLNQIQLAGQFIRLNHAADLTPLPPVEKKFGRVSKKHPRKNTIQVRDFVAGKAVLVRSIHIARLGHAWSGGDDKLPFHAKGPDAGKLMLAFFSRHRRKA
ncbi:alpha/beta hydrolase family esterase [Herbaspirillum rhizosphaerae]|uniref:extracellular catalytic domain type 1 short-chain-length polyhydroxyalkanoate depolymerase n=1 Tax=Herbaspirillum rhizosphaerae TaxID=346179 RepID=UPI000B17F9A8|nr:PHB depolymerase family esterase [Herbaspirillum rhizosphaerae]